MLRVTGLTLCASLTGCSALFGEEKLDISIKNENSKEHTVSATMNGFDGTASLEANTSKEFNNVLSYSKSPIEKTITVKMSGSPVDTHKFILQHELKTLIIIVTDEGRIEYGRITSAPLIANNSSKEKA